MYVCDSCQFKIIKITTYLKLCVDSTNHPSCYKRETEKLSFFGVLQKILLLTVGRPLLLEAGARLSENASIPNTKPDFTTTRKRRPVI
jgi:hypothetical protein